MCRSWWAKAVRVGAALLALCLPVCTSLTEDEGVLPLDPTKATGVPVISVAPRTFNLSYRLGDPAVGGSFDVWNSGDVVLDLTVSTAGTPWLSVSAQQYLLNPMGADTLSATFTAPAAMVAPSATPLRGVIHLSGSGAAPESVLVYLTVIDTSVVEGSPVHVSPDTVAFTYFVGGPLTVDSARVWTGAAGAMSVTFGGADWLHTSVDSLLVPAGDTMAVAVTIDTSGLARSDSVYVTHLVATGPGSNPGRDSLVVKVRVFARPRGMVRVPARDSTFLMGDNGGDYDEMPAHTVSFTYDLWVDTTEVSQAEYLLLSGAVNPSVHTGADLPVESLNWYAAVRWCNERSKRDGLDTVYTYTGAQGNELLGLVPRYGRFGYRLPTEAEWEYLCRARTTTKFHWGNATAADTLNKYVWYEGNSANTTHGVASKSPNGFGLYGMAGNVWEMCTDWHAADYSGALGVDPVVASSPTNERVVRGGGYRSVFDPDLKYTQFRSAYRLGYDLVSVWDDIGFRCVLPVRTPAAWQ